MDRDLIPQNATVVQAEDLSAAVDGLLDIVIKMFPDGTKAPPDVFEAVLRAERAKGVSAIQQATVALWKRGAERPPGDVAISLERGHQLGKGFSLAHDRMHQSQELVTAAIYLLSAGRLEHWPWFDSSKHVDEDYDQGRRLIVAGALAAAEYDRLAP